MLARLIGALLLAAVAVVAILGVTAPWSPSAWLALITLAALAAILLATQPITRRRLAAIARLSTLLFLAERLIGAVSGDIRMLTLPHGHSSRWFGRALDERDIALAGARLIGYVWPLPKDERERLVPAMAEACSALRRDHGAAPSPVLDTLLLRQRPDAFDTLVIEPPGNTPASAAVVFLHGYGGSFTLSCWLVAEAAREIGAVTVCPAADFSGHWSGSDGERTVRGVLDSLRARGIQRVYLAGLSNGAVGAAAMSHRLRSSLKGLILISGAPSSGGSSALPTLVVQGDHDPMASAATARAFAARTGATYAGFDGGHFVLLVRRAETRAAIAAWLKRRAGRE